MAQVRDRLHAWWFIVYKTLVTDMHLNIETEEQLDRRLGDNEANWRAAQAVPEAV